MSAPLPGRTLVDLDGDVLAHCARHLGARDVASLAMACRPLHAAAYCDAVWYRLYREQWPFQQVPRGALGIRELYIRRHTEVHQMKFDDPLSSIYYLDPTESMPSHLMLDRNGVWFSQGPVAKRLRLGLLDMELVETYRSHSARITCMRLFSLTDTPLYRSDAHTNEKALVTSSTDRTVRLCWKILFRPLNRPLHVPPLPSCNTGFIAPLACRLNLHTRGLTSQCITCCHRAHPCDTSHVAEYVFVEISPDPKNRERERRRCAPYNLQR